MNKNIENYQILKSIGKGGMGEVFLAHDPTAGRDVALKQMREKWAENKTMQGRFLREARIAAQLSHPSIIPIYEIDREGTYYTMPHIEGETLSMILRKTKEQAKQGAPLHPIGSSVPALIRIFLSICGAMAYAHTRGVLHRDLKPENIMVGKFGEVIILDWGLANFIDHPEKNGLHFKDGPPHLTQPGKIPGTLLYMAPERAFGCKSSVQTDIYSLGVMLYQILTLQLPFKRNSIKEFRKLHKYEEIHDPEEVAPDRDISPQLSKLVQKCLAKEPEERYSSLSDLINDLENYIEGLPEWLETHVLKIEKKEDWEFQENVALTKHMALTRGIEMLEWVNLMISKAQFPGNLKIEMQLTLKDHSKGLGILFCVPESDLQKGPEQAFLLWLSDEGMRLYRSNVEVVHHEQSCLETNRSYSIRIEKIDHHIRFFIDGVQKFGFLSHIPLPGSRVGLLIRDGDFHLPGLSVAVGSQHIMVNCLAVPDAFLAHKNYDEALREYRKISHSFPGRAEGREATFRAGMTLLKKAQNQRKKKEKEELYTQALEEYEKLHKTPGAPLEYLGKSLVYKSQNEIEEETKCLELALRKFPKHPLKPILVENILSRLHESAQNDRQGAYRFALMILRHLPLLPDAETTATILEKHLQPLPFFFSSENKKNHIAIQLAFWLNQPMVLTEMIENGIDPVDAKNAQIALILLGHEELADLKLLDDSAPSIQNARFNYALKKGNAPTLSPESDETIKLWSALLKKEWSKAEAIVKKIPQNKLIDEKNTLFFLYGCFLAHYEGGNSAIAHLTLISESPTPPIPALLSHYLLGRINLKKGWIEKAFLWEKLKLHQQLELYSLCLNK